MDSGDYFTCECGCFGDVPLEYDDEFGEMIYLALEFGRENHRVILKEHHNNKHGIKRETEHIILELKEEL